MPPWRVAVAEVELAEVGARSLWEGRQESV